MPKLIVMTPTAFILNRYVKENFLHGEFPLDRRMRAEKANYPYYDKLSFTLWSVLNDTPYTRGEQDLPGWNSMEVNEHSWTRPNYNVEN